MAVVVIGGHSRNVGKTSVVAGLIAALPELNWTALKITQFGHGVCSVSAEPCECALNETVHAWSVDEESHPGTGSDTSRFLAAGAQRVFWVRTKQGQLALAMPAVRAILAASENAIIESNSLIRFVRPDAYVSVLDFETKDFKASAREYLDRADAILLHESGAPRWGDVSLKLIAGKPTFRFEPPVYVSEEFIAWMRARLGAHTTGITSRS